MAEPIWFPWEALAKDEAGMPVHLPMGVTADGQGPTNDSEAHHLVCWCGTDCPLNKALTWSHRLGRVRSVEDAADALVWVKPAECPCEHPEDCCGSEESCDAMRPINRVVGEQWLRGWASKEADWISDPDLSPADKLARFDALDPVETTGPATTYPNPSAGGGA